MLEIYLKNNNKKCDETKKFLSDNNIEYVEYDVIADVDRAFELKERCPEVTHLPIVLLDNVVVEDIKTLL